VEDNAICTDGRVGQCHPEYYGHEVFGLGNFRGQYASVPFLTLLPGALLADRGIFVCHQRIRKHPSGASLAARHDADHLERPLGRSLPWRQSLHLSHPTCQLLYTVPGIPPWNVAQINKIVMHDYVPVKEIAKLPLLRSKFVRTKFGFPARTARA
jgi:hypothetical protein